MDLVKLLLKYNFMIYKLWNVCIFYSLIFFTIFQVSKLIFLMIFNIGYKYTTNSIF